MSIRALTVMKYLTNIMFVFHFRNLIRSTVSGSRTFATLKMKLFVTIINGFQSLTIVTKDPILDEPVVVDTLLTLLTKFNTCFQNNGLIPKLL